MRASRALVVAATAGAAIGLCVPVAAATNAPNGGGPNGGSHDRPRNVTVEPSRVHQGGQLAVSASGCSRGGVVSSNAFPRTALTINRSGQSAATPRVYDNATPGQYTLAVRCNDSGGRGGDGGRGGNGFDEDEFGRGGNGEVVTRTFTVIRGRGTEGGLGGSMAPTSAETAVGAGLVASAALGGGLFISRRRRLIGGRA
ncbi:hypothetical protein C6N75_28985 [Streptomyces solincola]|uniref:Integral membrane protein n=1 Tax=Streptomyces solincola TaxID=2100817 RepID=A0A2S9PN50_9ACTN|nr:hypothetical protein [Streptomyces solincola]PRH75810.1 hypothetical protein C6N75_28985 [Streptomyces solincola]